MKYPGLAKSAQMHGGIGDDGCNCLSIDRCDAAADVRAASRQTRSTQPCIPSGSLNRVPASAGVRAGMSPLPGGR